MAIGTRMTAVFAAIALGTSGAFAQTVSARDKRPGAAATETANQDRAAVAPGTGLPPADDHSAQLTESGDVISTVPPPVQPYDPSSPRGSEPSFLFMVR